MGETIAHRLSIRDLARAARASKAARRSGFAVALMIVVVGFLDVISTDLALATGTAWEANPLIRATQTALGPLWVVPKLLLHGLLGYMVMWYPNRTTLITMSVVSGMVLLAAISNFSIYLSAIGAL